MAFTAKSGTVDSRPGNIVPGLGSALEIFTFIQSNGSISSNGSGVSTYSISYNSNVTIGNLLIVTVASWVGNLSISDSRGNRWSPLNHTKSGTSTSAAVFYCLAKDSGACTVTITGSSFFPTVCVMEFSVRSGYTTVLDSYNVADGTSSIPSVSSISLSSTDLVIGVIAADANPTMTPNSSYASAYNNTGGPGAEAGNTIYWIDNTNSTASPSWTLSSSVAYSAIAVAFRAVVPIFSLVQTGGTDGTNSAGVTTFSATFPSNVTAGNLLVVGVGNFGSTVSCSDNLGNTYSPVQINNGTTYALLFTATSVASGSCTITLSSGTAFYPGVGLAEFSGSSFSVSSTATGTSNGASSVSTSALTFSSTCLILGILGVDGNAKGTPTFGYFPAYVSTGGVGAEASSLIYSLNDVHSSSTPTWLLSSSTHHCAMAGAVISVASSGNARISQVGALIVAQGNPSARISQIGAFVIVPKLSVGGVILVGMNGLKKVSDFTGGMN